MNKFPAIFGIKGKNLSDDEVAFFKDINPYGYIIFARNIESGSQLTELVNSIKALAGGDIAILVDQEGGRVARLKPPVVAELYPPAASFTALAQKDLDEARAQVFKNYYKIGTDLKSFGINVDCAPMADLLTSDSHNIIGDRSFGTDVDIVVALSQAAAFGLWAAGVQPILKHLPGHGRATVDSHQDLPVVKAELSELETTDFNVFKQLNPLPAWVMTAHVVYDALDEEHCFTVSKKGIDYARTKLGYHNHLVLSDDLSMKALSGGVGNNATCAIQAGCDVILHCNGDLAEMKEIAQALTDLEVPLISPTNIEELIQSIKIPEFYTEFV